MKIFKNIHRSAENFNNEEYPLFLFEDILHISVKKNEKILTKVILHLIVEYLYINIGNKNSHTLFFDILYYTTIVYEDCTWFETWMVNICSFFLWVINFVFVVLRTFQFLESSIWNSRFLIKFYRKNNSRLFIYISCWIELIIITLTIFR